jgi:glycosyltransferase involved in cell wall biosynthesis
MPTDSLSSKVAVVDPSLFSLPYDLHLCEGLAQAGAETVLFGRAPRRGELVPKTGFTFSPWFYSVSESQRGKLPRRIINILKGLEHVFDMTGFARHARRKNFNAVHFQWMAVPAVDRYLVKRLKKSGIPVVMTVHDTVPFNAAPSSRGQNLGWKSTLDLFDAIIVHTAMSKSNLEQAGLRVPIHEIPHGLLRFGQAVQSSTSQRLRLLFFGAIKPYKGLDVLLRAFKEANADGKMELRIVGNCQDGRTETEALISELGLQNVVRFECRFFADEEVPAMLSEADVVVFPYRRIDGSGALLTALAYGKPVIATNVGVFGELITDPTALVDPNSIESLAQKLRSLSENPEVLNKLQEIATETARRIPDWKTIARQTLELYQSLR